MDIRKALVFSVIAVFILANFPVAAADDQTFEACKLKLQKANELGVLYAFDWKPPKEPHVVAGKTFFSISIDAKEGFAETLSCFLVAGDTSKCANFDILHWQTGKAVGRFQNCRLKMK